VDAFEREAARNGGAELAWFAPRDSAVAIDEIEHDLAVLRPLLMADPESVRGQAAYLLELSPELGRSLRARWWRWRPKWSYADGLCERDDATRAELSKYRLTVRAYSPTSLQNFAACPYKFLLSAVYRLSPREDPVPLQTLDPLTRGGMYHAVLARFLRQARDSKCLPLTATKLSKACRQLDETLDAVAAEMHDALAPAIERVWQDEVEGLRADLRGWLTHLFERADGYVPGLIEYAFGLPSDGDRDPLSTTVAATVPGGYKLHGIMDLVETKDGGQLRVTDHKTGKNRTEEGMVVGGGEVLQPILYSLALEALGKQAVAEARLSFCTAAGGYQDRIVAITDHARAAGGDVLHVIDSAIECGFIPPAPKEHGCQWCDYRAVCGPYEETRVSRKDAAPLAPLLDLREME
jgi:ATP-dependent helicase/nuclease subunit B